jgi:hypothetical protein
MLTSLSNAKLKNLNKMKTIINISNLKKMVVSIATAMVLTTGIFAGSTPARNEETAYTSRLDALMTATGQSIRFVAPAVEESQDVFYALEVLNTLAESTEASVKYVAPAAEDETLAPELESLNIMAEMIEANIKYVAPAIEETQEVASAMEELDRLAAETETAVAFRASGADDSIQIDANAENQMTNLILADETK